MRVILIALLLIIPISTHADAQTQTFTREGVEYVLDLPSPSWRAVSRVDVRMSILNLSTVTITAMDTCGSARVSNI